MNINLRSIRWLSLMGILVSATVVPAVFAQHGGTDHLTGTGAFGDVALVGQVTVHDAAEGIVADVGVLGNYAYLGSFSQPDCAGPEGGGPDGGVYVIDISDPTNPVEVGFIAAHQDTYVGEGVQAVHIDTPEFEGDVLTMNLEGCGKNYRAGMSLWDITDPLHPKKLFENVGDFVAPDGTRNTPHDANQTHSAFVWDAGDNAYVVTTDDDEISLTDVDVMDITDPKHPVLIAEYALNAFDIAQPNEGLDSSFLHDMVVKEIGGQFIMLLSYWDGGYVLLDVTDPVNPVFLDDTEFTIPDPERAAFGEFVFPEGNGHQAEFTSDNAYIVAADEDFSPYGVEFQITTGPNAGSYLGGQFGWTIPIKDLPDGVLNGPTVYGGYGCPDDVGSIPSPAVLGALAPDEEAILVLSRGPVNDPSHNHAACFFSEKVEAAQNAGYGGVIISNHHNGAAAGALPDARLCGGQGHVFTPTIPGLCIGHRAMHLLFNTAPDYTVPYPAVGTEPAIGALGEDVEGINIFDGWGYVHLYDANSLAELDTFAIPESQDESYALGFGDLSVHEVATDPTDANLAYLSYYSGGFRALDLTGGVITEVGGYLDPNGNNFWGVQVWTQPGTGDEYILASDRDSGLWIFEYTGP